MGNAKPMVPDVVKLDGVEAVPSEFVCDKLVLTFPKREASELAAKSLPGLQLAPNGQGSCISRQGYWIANMDHPSHPDQLLPYVLGIMPLWTRCLGIMPTVRVNRIDICLDFQGTVEEVAERLTPCKAWVQKDMRVSYLLSGSSQTNFALAAYDKGLERGGRRDLIGRFEARANRGGIDKIFKDHGQTPLIPYAENKCPLGWAYAFQGCVGQIINMVELRTRNCRAIKSQGFLPGDRRPSAEHERRRRVAVLKRALVASDSLQVQLGILAELTALANPESRLEELVADFSGHFNGSK